MAKRKAAAAQAETSEPADTGKRRTGQKRAAGEGCIIHRPNGLWEARVRVTDPGDNSKQKRVSVYGKTQGEVLSKLEAMREQRRTSPKSLLAKDSLGAYLDRWLSDDVAVNRSAKTFEEYEGAVRLYVKPWLGAEKLSAVDGEKLVQWQAALSRRKMTPNTRARAIRVLTNALSKAVKLRILPFNPCAALDRPKVVREERRPLEPDECAALFEVCRNDRLGDMIILAALTGMRKGELIGLEWSAVNLAEGVLSVRRSVVETQGKRLVKEPKTQASRRVVTLGVEAVEALQRRLEKAKAEGMEPELVPIVFPNSVGKHLHGSNFDRRIWHPIRKAAGLPESFFFHDLRHTQASLMLAAGVDMKTIQKRLGHRDFVTTANVYSHLLANAQADAVAKVDELLKRAKKGG